MKSVHELSAEEFEELRERYIIEFDLDHDRISDEEVRQYYSGTSFVEEDFFCNITDEEELNYYEVYDELTNKNLFIQAHSNEQAIELSETIDFDDYENNDRVDLISNKFICNCCGGFFPREEMDFDVDDDQDLCKNCNYQSYNEAPYGQD